MKALIHIYEYRGGLPYFKGTNVFLVSIIIQFSDDQVKMLNFFIHILIKASVFFYLFSFLLVDITPSILRQLSQTTVTPVKLKDSLVSRICHKI